MPTCTAPSRQRAAVAFIAEAQADAVARHRHPHQLADGDIGGRGIGRRGQRDIAGIVQQRQAAAAAPGRGTPSGTSRLAGAGSGIATPGGSGVGSKTPGPKPDFLGLVAPRGGLGRPAMLRTSAARQNQMPDFHAEPRRLRSGATLPDLAGVRKVGSGAAAAGNRELDLACPAVQRRQA